MISYPQFLLQNLRWLLGGMLLTVSSSFGQTFYIALFSAELRELFSLSHGAFGAVYMAGTLASAVTLLWLGKIVDRLPIATVAAGVFAGLAVCCVAMANVASVPMLVLVIFGLRLFGQGMMTHTAMTAMGRWYARERGRAVATSSVGHQIGEGLLPALVAFGLTVLAWRQLWWAAAALLLVAGAVAFSLFRRERIPTTAEHKTLFEGRQWTRRQVLGDRMFWCLCLAILAPAFIGTSHFFHFVHISAYKGWTREWAAISYTLLSVCTVSCTLIAGWMVDRFSARHLLPVFLIPLGVGCLVLSVAVAPAWLMLFMALLGISYGIASAMFGALWPEIYGVRHLGAIRSITVAMMVLSSALGPGVTGLLLDIGISYDLQLRFMAAYCFACALAMLPVSRILLARQPHPTAEAASAQT